MDNSTRPAPLTEREQAATDLVTAAALIHDNGLCTGRFHDRLAGTYDPLGAIHEAVAPGFWSLDPEQVYMDPQRKRRCHTAITLLKRFLRLTALAPMDYGAVSRWADEPGRTAEQVTAALTGASYLAAESAIMASLS